MAKKSTQKSIKDSVLDAALMLAAEEGWTSIDLKQIIMAANVSETEALEYFDDKEDILIAYGRRIDAQMKANVDFGSEELSEREKIFDIIMERFDIVNDNRDAVLSILNSMRTDPKQMIISLPHLGRSMGRVLDMAGVQSDGFGGAVKVTGLIGVYLYTLRTWKEDESPDMAKTMSALDKALDMAESTANSVDNGGILTTLSGLTERFCSKEK